MIKLSLAAFAAFLFASQVPAQEIVQEQDNHLLPVKCDNPEHVAEFNKGLLRVLHDVRAMSAAKVRDVEIYEYAQARIKQGLTILHCEVIQEEGVRFQ